MLGDREINLIIGGLSMEEEPKKIADNPLSRHLAKYLEYDKPGLRPRKLKLMEEFKKRGWKLKSEMTVNSWLYDTKRIGKRNEERLISIIGKPEAIQDNNKLIQDKDTKNVNQLSALCNLIAQVLPEDKIILLDTLDLQKRNIIEEIINIDDKGILNDIRSILNVLFKRIEPIPSSMPKLPQEKKEDHNK
jgi:hypothetical protein